MKFVDILRDLMIKNKLNQTSLAKILCINQTTISQWLLGRKKPNYDNILMIYEKFGITPNEIFGIEEYFD